MTRQEFFHNILDDTIDVDLLLHHEEFDPSWDIDTFREWQRNTF